MKIAYLIGCYPAINHGYLLREIQILRELGFEVEVASINDPDRPAAQLSGEEGAETRRTRYIKATPILRVLGDHLSVCFRNPWRYLSALGFALALGKGWRSCLYHAFYFLEAVLVGRWLDDKRTDYLYVHFSLTVGLITTRIFPVRMSFGVYGFGELHDPAGTPLATKIQAAHFVRAISLHSRSLLMLESNPRDWGKIRYLPLGIDVNQYIPRDSVAARKKFTLMSVGRLAPEKGQRLLLECIAHLVQDGRDLCLRLVGDGPDRSTLVEQVRAISLSSHVVFEGWVDQPKLEELYAITDVFVMASLYEGIPIVLMEAMAMEIPCVAPRITGIPELISDRVEGLLFAPTDLKQFAACIAELQDHPDLRLSIGKAARERVMRDYDIHRNTRTLADVLASKPARLDAGLSRYD